MTTSTVSQATQVWESLPLNQIAEVVRGVTYKKQDAVEVPGSGLVPILRTTNISDFWVTDTDNDQVRIDPASGKQLATVHTNEAPIHVLPVGGALWVTTFDGGTLQRIDPATNAVTATVDVGDGADGLLQHKGSLWVTTDRANTVVRVDPSGPSVVPVWDVGTQPHNGVFANGSLWTAAFYDGQLLRLHLP